MKKTIRLTESDIRKMVMEVVSGLDPRTLASYAQKRLQQGKTNKAAQGFESAADTWNKKFSTANKSTIIDKNGNEQDATHIRRMEPAFRSDDPRRSSGLANGLKVTDRLESNDIGPDYNPTSSRTFTDNLDGNSNMNYNGQNVAQQMADGSGTYVPGKGWMEEAVTRAIRKYLK